MELRGPSNIYATVADAGDGTYTATLNTLAAGDHMVHVSTGALQIIAVIDGLVHVFARGSGFRCSTLFDRRFWITKLDRIRKT